MKLPGSAIAEEVFSVEEAEALLAPMFLSGGLMLSQVSHITGLPPYMIQNWVRRGFLPPPERKRYTRRQLSRILLINMLRDAMRLEEICLVISHMNGRLDDESDDLIGDDGLYLAVVACLLDLDAHAQPTRTQLDKACETALERCGQTFAPEAGRRVLEGLRVMSLGVMAGRLHREVETLFQELKGGKNSE